MLKWNVVYRMKMYEGKERSDQDGNRKYKSFYSPPHYLPVHPTHDVHSHPEQDIGMLPSQDPATA